MEPDQQEVPDQQGHGRACGGLRKELKECILKSDCVVKNKNDPNYCMRTEAEGVTEECRKVQYAFFECKRSMLDFRARFRGRKGY